MTQKGYKNNIIDNSIKKIYEMNQYLQGKHLLYQIKLKNTDTSTNLNYKIYDSAEWSDLDKQKVNLEEGFYVFAKGDGITNVGEIRKLFKTDGLFSTNKVFSKVDSSTNTPTEVQILMDYTNPNSIKTFSTEAPPPDDVVRPRFTGNEISAAIYNITGLDYNVSTDFIVEQNPNLIGCIITTFVDEHQA